MSKFSSDLIQRQREVPAVDIRPGDCLEVGLGLILGPGLCAYRLPGLGALPRLPGPRVFPARVSVNR